MTNFDQEKWLVHYERSKMTMKELAERLSVCLVDGVHKVVDQTGMKGNYQIAYDCPVPRPQTPVSTGTAAGTIPPDPQDGSPLFRSLDELGLKLEKRKLPMDIYVIDHIEVPSDN